MSKATSSPLTKDILAKLSNSIPGVDGSAVPPKLQKAIDYALQELAKCARPATRRSPAEPTDPIQFIVEKLREFAQIDRDTVSQDELAAIKKRRSRRGGRRGSVVCSKPTKSIKPKGWKPTPVPKSDEIRSHLKEMVAKSILLHGANELTLDTVVDCMFECTFQAGATIIKEGDPGDNLYLCTEGWIQVYKFIKATILEEEGTESKVIETKTESTPVPSLGQDTLVARMETGKCKKVFSGFSGFSGFCWKKKMFLRFELILFSRSFFYLSCSLPPSKISRNSTINQFVFFHHCLNLFN